LGVSVLEISHRSAEYVKMYQKTVDDLRDIAGIPSNFEVLYMQGGCTLQFSAVPLNLMKGSNKARYLNTGNWSEQAMKEAKTFGKATPMFTWDPKGPKHNLVPDVADWKFDPEDNYLYYCDNETVNGVEFDFYPSSKSSYPRLNCNGNSPLQHSNCLGYDLQLSLQGSGLVQT
jgi:phosphoserine aminotransferase